MPPGEASRAGVKRSPTRRQIHASREPTRRRRCHSTPATLWVAMLPFLISPSSPTEESKRCGFVDLVAGRSRRLTIALHRLRRRNGSRHVPKHSKRSTARSLLFFPNSDFSLRMTGLRCRWCYSLSIIVLLRWRRPRAFRATSAVSTTCELISRSCWTRPPFPRSRRSMRIREFATGAEIDAADGGTASELTNPAARAQIVNWRARRDAIVEQHDRLVLRHEAAHQLFYRFGVHQRSAANPVWLVEGLACQFETSAGPGAVGPPSTNPLPAIRPRTFRSSSPTASTERRSVEPARGASRHVDSPQEAARPNGSFRQRPRRTGPPCSPKVGRWFTICGHNTGSASRSISAKPPRAVRLRRTPGLGVSQPGLRLFRTCRRRLRGTPYRLHHAGPLKAGVVQQTCFCRSFRGERLTGAWSHARQTPPLRGPSIRRSMVGGRGRSSDALRCLARLLAFDGQTARIVYGAKGLFAPGFLSGLAASGTFGRGRLRPRLEQRRAASQQPRKILMDRLLSRRRCADGRRHHGACLRHASPPHRQTLARNRLGVEDHE